MSLLITSRITITDTNGEPVVGAKMKVYEPTTTTFMNLWLDKDFSVAAQNSAGSSEVTDANGRFPALYVDGTHKMVITDSADAEIFSDDDIQAAAVASATTSAEGVVQFATPAQVAASTPGFVINTGDISSIPLDATNVSGVLNVNNIPDLPASKITSGTLDAARLPLATETAVGAVEKATAAEVTAGTADKYIDAALLQTAIAVIAQAEFTGASNKYVKITTDTGDLLIQWDTETVNPNSSTNVTLDQNYADTTYAIFVTANDASESRSENNGAVVISASTIQLWSGDSSVNSLFWFTIGKGA